MSKPIVGIGSDVHVAQGERDRAFVYVTYTETLRRAGAIPVLIPPQPENAADIIDALDGLVLAGGEDCDPSLYGEERHHTVEPMDPRRQNNDLALAKLARDKGIPTLGICLGLQVMNVAAGGTLVQDIDSHITTEIRHASDPSNRNRHDVTVGDGTRLASIIGAGPKSVNSSHHQSIKDVAEGFRVTAHAPDGIVEGIEDTRHPFYLGVQWHPEDMAGEQSASTLFGAFIEAARRHAAGKRRNSTELSRAAAAAAE